MRRCLISRQRHAIPKELALTRVDAQTAKVIAGLLERVIGGDLDPQTALAQWPQTGAEPIYGDAWHDLAHFAADNDIREKDQRYADYQIELLTKRIAEIKKAHDLE